MVNHPNRKRPAKPTHTIPSGMGGVFSVIILKENNSDGVLVRTVGNSKEWNNRQFVVGRDELKPIEETP